MGRRRRIEKRADRKMRLASQKEKNADLARSIGKNRKASLLNSQARKLRAKALALEMKVAGKFVRGLTAEIVPENDLGNTVLKASWNYFHMELSRFEKLRVSITPASPMRSPIWAKETEIHIENSSVTFGLQKNLIYVVKLFGVKSRSQKLLDQIYI